MKNCILKMQNRSNRLVSKAAMVWDRLNEIEIGKRNYHIDEVIFLIMWFIMGGLSVIRCFYGIEITDEAYYVADAVGVFQGNLPFAYNTSNSAGMSLVSFPFLFVFRLFSSDNEGIFLYMRLCYTFFRFVVVFLLYTVLKKKYPRRALIPACLLLVPWIGFFGSIPNFSYNTSSFWLMLLSCAIISVNCRNRDRRSRAALFISGCIAALSVFAHPMQAGAVMTVCLLLVLLSEKRSKLWNFILYAAGGLTLAALVLFLISVQTGMRSLWAGLNIMLFHRLHFFTVSLKQQIFDFLTWLKIPFLGMIALFLGAMILSRFFGHCFDLGWKWKYRWLLSASFAVIPTLIYFCRGGSDSAYSYFGAISLWCALMIFPVIRDLPACFIIFPVLVFFVCEAAVPSVSIISGRTYFMFPILFATVLLLGSDNENSIPVFTNGSPRMLKAIVCMIACITAVLVIRSEYLYVYRDDPITKLDHRVSEGVYKGLYTGADRAGCTIEVEEYIRNNTRPDERISFRDNVPFGYLMSNGVMCDIRAWDVMQYTYVVTNDAEDNPGNLFRYYKNTNSIPDKYIYIDYGRDKFVSYDHDSFKFNQWLNAYYQVTDETKINDRYSARIYEYNGTFDGDYDHWIDSVR